MTLTDSHCHLDGPRFASDLEAVVERAAAAGVSRILTIGTGDGPPNLDRAIHIAERFENVYASVGVHPHDASKCDPRTFDDLRSLGRHEQVVGFGEIGLDYHYDFSPRETQRDVFIEQLKIARDLSLPVIIHSREAWEDTIDLLRRHWSGPGIMHCFTGNADQAEEALALGLHIAFGGILTYKDEKVREAAARVPDNRLLTETDAPYLAPVPFRGKRNEPAMMIETARVLASLRNTSLERIAEITSANFEQLCLRPEKTNRYTGDSHGD
jgi:TatD DNase family protein